MKKLLAIVALSLLAFACTSDSPDEIVNFCQKPVGLDAYSVTNTTVTLNWQSPVTTSEYKVEYGPLEFTQGNGITTTVPQSSYNVSELSPSTQYSYYVNLFCSVSNNYSDWAGPYEFTTLNNNPLCEDPTNLQLLNNSSTIGSDYVNLRWDDYGNDGSQIQYGVEGFTLGTGTIQSEGDDINNGFGTIENLNSDTAYDFYVRNNCEENGFSEWIGPLTVTTIE